ncbi:MAG: hypothetical protein HOP19_24435, partial [Acidobacteria bacterium]|nr:hypothetical protein [Acidobacteriota bacterium]
MAAVLGGLLLLTASGGLYARASAQGVGVPQFTNSVYQRFAGAVSAKLSAWGWNYGAKPNLASSAMACTLTQTVTVTGCYYATTSKATVSVEVGWTGASSGDTITVSLDGGAQTRTIKPESLYNPGTGTNVAGPIRTPQVVAFDIAADGGGHMVDVAMTGSMTCSAAQFSFNAPANCDPNLCTTGELGGTVFIDYDADGGKDSGELYGVAGVTATAFDKNGATYTATSNSEGRYEFSAANSNAIAAADYPVRLEFTTLPASSFTTTTPQGADNGSSVQFISAATCGNDVGVMDQAAYAQDNPLVMLPCFVNGDPAPNVTATDSGDADALVGFPYNSSGGPTPALISHMATARQVGSLWGLAYNKYTKRLFSAATLRRHVGLGPQGLGGIYVTNLTNPASPSTGNFISVVTNLGIDVGQASVASNSARGLTSVKTSPNYDTAVFSLVGKVGIGDIDISEDGNTLWFVNLFDKKLYSVDITAYNAD